jgi:hypothetical protein
MAELPFIYAGASCDITPQQPVPLAGYGGRRNPFIAVSSKLESNAVLLSASGRRLLFVSVDALFVGQRIVDAVIGRASQFGLSADDVVVTASHTHFAPPLDDTKPLLGAVDEGYLRFVTAQLLALVDEVMMRPPAAVTLEQTRIDTALNVGRRRRWNLPLVQRRGITWPPTVIMAPAPDAERDTSIDVIRVVGANGTTRATFWKFAAHPVCFPDIDRVSAEYPGHARAALRRALGDEIPVVFWQGFAGDVRPSIGIPPSTSPFARARKPRFVQVTHTVWQTWADAVAQKLVAAATARDARQLTGSLTASSIDIAIQTLIEPATPSRAMRIQLVSLGSKQVLFVGAEVCSPYARLLRLDAETIRVGYAGDVFGYLPSTQQVREGGYEARDFFEVFGLRGRWRTGFETAVRSAVDTLRARLAGMSAGGSALPVERRQQSANVLDTPHLVGGESDLERALRGQQQIDVRE